MTNDIEPGRKPENQIITQSTLQKTFIAMLFAFAVSIVAQQISELLIVSTKNWTTALGPWQILDNIHGYAWPILAAATHSLLALLMLTVSWVMWSKSQAAGHVIDISEIFSIKFITFLLEILLVTLYFSLSKSVEVDFINYTKEKTVAAYLTPASARPEAMQMLWIFLIFALWDFIVDVAKSPQFPQPSSRTSRLLSFFTGIFTYCAVSIFCAIGALFVYLLAPIEGAVEAVVGDIALIILLLLFNRAKSWENYIFIIFPAEKTRNNTKREPTPHGNYLILFLIFFYILCLISIRFIIPCLH